MHNVHAPSLTPAFYSQCKTEASGHCAARRAMRAGVHFEHEIRAQVSLGLGSLLDNWHSRGFPVTAMRSDPYTPRFFYTILERMCNLGPNRPGKNPDPELAELSVPEVRRLLEIALPLPPRSRTLRIAWSHWRRAKRQQARRSHYRRRGAHWPETGIHRNSFAVTEVVVLVSSHLYLAAVVRV